MGITNVVEMNAAHTGCGQLFHRPQFMLDVGRVRRTEPVDVGTGRGLLQAALSAKLRNLFRRRVVEVPADFPGMHVEPVGFRGRQTLPKLVAVEVEGPAAGQEGALVMGAPRPGDVGENGINAVLGQHAAGAIPIAGKPAGGVMVPDTAKFAGARRLQGGIAAYQCLS